MDTAAKKIRVDLPIATSGYATFLRKAVDADPDAVAVPRMISFEAPEVASAEAPAVMTYLPNHGRQRTVRKWNGAFYERGHDAEVQMDWPRMATGTSFLQRRMGFAGLSDRRGLCLTEQELAERTKKDYFGGSAAKTAEVLSRDENSVVAIDGKPWIRVREPVLVVTPVSDVNRTEMELRGFHGGSGVFIEQRESDIAASLDGLGSSTPERVFNVNDWKEADAFAAEYARDMSYGPPQYAADARSIKILDPSAFGFDRKSVRRNADTVELAAYHISKFLNDYARTAPAEHFQTFLALRDAHRAAALVPNDPLHPDFDPKESEFEISPFEIQTPAARRVVHALHHFLFQEQNAKRLKDRVDTKNANELIKLWASKPAPGVEADVNSEPQAGHLRAV